MHVDSSDSGPLTPPYSDFDIACIVESSIVNPGKKIRQIAILILTRFAH